MQPETSFDTFQQLDIRTGIVKEVKEFPQARDPAYRIWVDFGDEIGTLKTSAKLTDRYSPADLEGEQVVGIVNFPDKQIADFMSEFLLLGAVRDDDVVILTTETDVEPGTEIG